MAMALVGDGKGGVSKFQGFQHRRPMMLKDYLRDGAGKSAAAAAGRSGKQPVVLRRSRSRRAAATTISAIQKVINVVRNFQFETAAAQHRRRKIGNAAAEETVAPEMVKVKVKVKDILRWRSFRDLEEDESKALDFPTCPNPTVTTSSRGKTSSWCDSDEFLSKNASAFRSIKEDCSIEESEQQESPVSVLYSPFREELSTFKSPFRRISPINVQRAKCDVKRRFSNSEVNKNGEERAKQLLECMELGEEDDDSRGLMMDFFMEEKLKEESELLRAARSWKNGEFEETYQWELEDRRKAYVEDMEKGFNWSRFSHEHDEISMELHVWVLEEIFDEVIEEFLAQ
ncbi:uncharacterized protein LOC127253424 [Andrographis paniculata]|uniref:uncharacterized protein LOC127253424 n=1 Tax=Andrographis paniculata TaxID=175694 RepID=UPI0021E84790|nr:uncharacterized protein LOC127253424 [Andrographis paniculata]